MSKKDLVVGLDIGTTKICAIVGDYDENGNLNVIGVGNSPSRGLKKGRASAQNPCWNIAAFVPPTTYSC